jgi:hypothetical protein
MPQSVKFKKSAMCFIYSDRFDVQIEQLQKITQPDFGVISSGSDRLLPSKVEVKTKRPLPRWISFYLILRE